MFQSTVTRPRLIALLATALLLPSPGFAGLADLSDNPLSSATTSQVKPNILFVLDDSGSMGWDFMPDNMSSSTIGRRNHQCNLVYYNPGVVYVVPKTSTGDAVNSGTPSSFSAAYNAGFHSYSSESSSTSNLITSFRAHSGDTSQPAYYWKYLGSTTLVPNAGDCNKSLSSSSDSTTNEYCTDGTRTTTTCAAAGKTALWRKIIVSSTSGPATADINGDGSTNASDQDEQLNFANWYSYYSDRLKMMKSATGRAFVGMSDSKRIGFITINPNSPVSSSKYLAIADFDTTQKANWFDKLYSQGTNGSTPLRQALSRAGRHFAAKTNGINSGMSGDPVQYSCQQNFAILTTDGYWNGAGGEQLDGTTDIVNHDGNISELDIYRPSGSKFVMAPRPIYDGGSTLYTYNTAANTYQTATCTYSTQAQQRTRQYQTCSSTSSGLQARTSTNSGGSWTGWSDYPSTTCEDDAEGSSQRECRYGTVTHRRKSSSGGSWYSTSSCSFDNSGGSRYECRRVSSNLNCVGTWSDSQCTNTDPSTEPLCRSSAGAWSNVASCTAAAQNASGVATECQTVTTPGFKLQVGEKVTSRDYTGPGGTGTALGSASSSTSNWTDKTPVTCYATAPSLPADVAITGGGPPTPPANCASGSQVWPCDIYSSGSGVNASVSGAVWTAPGADPTVDPATATYTTSAAHSFLAGHTVTITSVSPSGYRGTFEIVDVPDSTHFKVNLPSDPGAYSSSGTATLYGGSTNSLSDVAQYYYKTDLRNSGLSNCTGALGIDVCSDNVPATGDGAEDDRASWQHMTTFTMGLGLTGTVVYSKNYKTDECQAVAIASGSWSSNVVTMTTSAAHGFYVNESITIAGGNFAGYRGQFRIASVPSTTSFTYSLSSNPGGVFGTGTVTACPDFARIRSGNLNWPVPYADSATALDDLWHAAVDGRGQYFSAGDPETVVTSLTNALAGINARVAAAAAAATSNLEPVAGDNFAYTAKYKTQSWTGDLEAREIDLTTGAVSGTVIWSAQAKLDAITKAACDNRTIKLFRAGATNNLVDFSWNSSACDAGGAPTGVAATGLNATEQAYFDSTKVALLSQYPNLGDGTGVTVDQRTAAAGANLVNFVRGQRGKEGFDSSDSDSPKYINKLYRTRENVLGDIINAQPVFVKSPFAEYDDTGYSAYKSAKASRAPTVYSAANDGMLHAINAGTSIVDTAGGTEAWAFIPSMVLPNLYKLASENYATEHTYSVDGTPTVGDVYDPQNIDPGPPAAISPAWKTILVSGLNKGGKGYYALDITDPSTPKALWEFKHDATNCVTVDATSKAPALSSHTTDCHLGYSFNNPIISKLRDGRWVVFVTSGYNNVNSPTEIGDGIGYLYVLNAMTGEIIYKIDTGVGTAGDPSGLNHINAWSEDPLRNNQTERVYGVDLKGNVWRFDVNDILNTSGREATLIATAVDGSGVGQPITTRPEIAAVKISGVEHPFVYVATGRYLGTTDLSDTQTQSVWAIRDALTSTTLTSLRTTLRKMVITNQGSGTSAYRTIGCTAQCGSTDGWFTDLPDTGERVNIDMKLQLGTLVVASNVPETNACNIGGYAWLNYFTNTLGEAVENSADNAVGRRLVGAGGQESLAVGLNIVRLPSGKTVVIATTSAAQQLTVEAPFDVPSPTGKRVSWREILQ
ncbi:MAG: hypothetical protein K9J42_00660 [Sulfuritalea sp.]|nr:hypothetical protein [Sulfuritalea sp.]